MRTALPAALVPALLAICPAQDPPPPPGGFDVQPILNVPVVWSDSYRTRMDLYHPIATPTAPAPATGWPGVLVLHGNNHSRSSVAGLARGLAAAGYATFAFDTRGDGQTNALNPAWPTPITPEELVLDMAESFAVASVQLGALLDLQRLGVTGRSQGGMYTQQAAAWSGLPLPPNYTTTFPVLGAVATQISPLDRVENVLPRGGELLRTSFADSLSQDPTSQAWLDALAGRYDLVLNAVAPTLDVLPLLRANTVPLFAAFGWTDTLVNPNNTCDAIQTLGAGVPFRVLVNPNGHGSPSNAIDTGLIDDTRIRWFDRFLKGRSNGVLLEPEFEAAITPVDVAVYQDPGSAWAHRAAAAWPPASSTLRLHLRGAQLLAPAPPAAAEPGALVQNLPAPGYDLAAFVAAPPPPLVFGNLPLDSRAFAGPPLPGELELFGRPEVDLWIDASAGDFQVAAALLVRDPGGQERYLTGGAGAVRGLAPGVHRVQFPLRDVATIVPAGWRVVVRVENLVWFRPPGVETIEYAPSFLPADLQVLVAPATPSSIALPVAGERVLALTPRLLSDDPIDGIDHPMTIDGGPARAGAPYLVGMSASGYGPGTSILGTHVPLNLDFWTNLGVTAAGGPELAAFVGTLDASGGATPHLMLPSTVSGAGLGLRWTFAVVAIDTTLVAGGPVQLDLVP